MEEIFYAINAVREFFPKFCPRPWFVFVLSGKKYIPRRFKPIWNISQNNGRKQKWSRYLPPKDKICYRKSQECISYCYDSCLTFAATAPSGTEVPMGYKIQHKM